MDGIKLLSVLHDLGRVILGNLADLLNLSWQVGVSEWLENIHLDFSSIADVVDDREIHAGNNLLRIRDWFEALSELFVHFGFNERLEVSEHGKSLWFSIFDRVHC